MLHGYSFMSLTMHCVQYSAACFPAFCEVRPELGVYMHNLPPTPNKKQVKNMDTNIYTLYKTVCCTCCMERNEVIC